MTTLTGAAPLPWTQRLLQHPLLDGQALSYWLEQLNPAWSLIEPRAKVTRIVEENHDTRSIELQPTWGWRAFKPGQHVGVSVEINAVRHRRRYSVSSAPVSSARGRFSITVKREAGGKVSNYLHDHLKIGDIMNLALPDGDFTLAENSRQALLMLAGGSGITPMMAHIEALLTQPKPPQITLLHFIRSQRDRIFESRLNELMQAHPQLKVLWCEEDQSNGRFNGDLLSKLVPDYREHHSLLCGPAGFMQVVRKHWDEQDIASKLQFEYFGSPIASTAGSGDVVAKLELSRSGRSVDIRADEAALLAMESAGETPAYGCRQGICQSCRCRKISGRTRNLISGEISQEPDVEIQLCITAAESDLVLDY